MIPVAYDGQAIMDLSMRVLLASAGYKRDKIDEIMPEIYKDTGVLADIMLAEKTSSKEFAVKVGNALRLIGAQHLRNSACPETAIPVNLAFILKAAADQSPSFSFPMSGGEGG